MATKDANYNPNAMMFDICKQRRRRQLLNVPPVRLELTESPYPNFSQRQLDMRRKVEILKYAPNLQSNQTNSQTQKEKLASLLKGDAISNIKRRNYQVCSQDDFIPTFTSGCDVPGPIIQLTYDEQVPLYQFLSESQRRAFSILPDNNTDPWYIIKASNVVLDVSNVSNVSEYSVFSSIYFRYILYQTDKSFTVGFPVSFSIDARRNTVAIDISYNIHIECIKTELDIYYNDTQITPNYSTPVSHLSTIDISGGNQDIHMQNIYVGHIEIPNVLLNSQTGYIYDLKTRLNVNTTVVGSSQNIRSLYDSFQVSFTVNPENQLPENTNNTTYRLLSEPIPYSFTFFENKPLG